MQEIRFFTTRTRGHRVIRTTGSGLALAYVQPHRATSRRLGYVEVLRMAGSTPFATFRAVDMTAAMDRFRDLLESGEVSVRDAETVELERAALVADLTAEVSA